MIGCASTSNEVDGTLIGIGFVESVRRTCLHNIINAIITIRIIAIFPTPIANDDMRGLVIFLPKHGKNPENITGWRPLTMLNSIYKICSGIVASRLDKVIEQVIHSQQYSFIKASGGRYRNDQPHNAQQRR